MKRILITIGILSLLFTPCALAAKEKSKSDMKHQGPAPNESAYEHASDNAKFKRAEDGKSGKHQSKDEDKLQGSEAEGHKHMEQDRHREEATKQKRKGNDGDADNGDADNGDADNGDADNGDADNGDADKEKKMKKIGDDDEKSSGHMEKKRGGESEKSRESESEQETDRVQY